MKRYFVVADVHGFYDEMMDALNKEGFEKDNPSHIFVSLGDLLDRGPKPQECLDFVNSLPDDRKILIMGNHEILMRQMIYGSSWPRYIDKKNGTWKSAVDITKVDIAEVIHKMRDNKSWRDYYDGCVYFAEVGDNIFVHGWIPCHGRMDINTGTPLSQMIIDDNWRDSDMETWEASTWYNGMADWDWGARIKGKTIWCGHWHTSYGHCKIHHACAHEFETDSIFDPFIDEGIVALDACTALSGKVNCMSFTVEE